MHNRNVLRAVLVVVSALATGCTEKAEPVSIGNTTNAIQPNGQERAGQVSSAEKKELDQLRSEVEKLRNELQRGKEDQAARRAGEEAQNTREQLQPFLHSARKLITSLETGMNFLAFSTQTAEVLTFAKEAMSSGINFELRSQIREFGVALQDAHELWSRKLQLTKSNFLPVEKTDYGYRLADSRIGGRFTFGFTEIVSQYGFVDERDEWRSSVRKNYDGKFQFNVDSGLKQIFSFAQKKFGAIEQTVANPEPTRDGEAARERDLFNQSQKVLGDSIAEFHQMTADAKSDTTRGAKASTPMTPDEKKRLTNEIAQTLSKLRADADESRAEFIRLGNQSIPQIRADMSHEDFLRVARPLQLAAIKAAFAPQPEPYNGYFTNFINAIEHANYLLQFAPQTEIKAKKVDDDWIVSNPPAQSLLFVSTWEDPAHWTTHFKSILVSQYEGAALDRLEYAVSKEVVAETAVRIAKQMFNDISARKR
jgi:hypothetical protein